MFPTADLHCPKRLIFSTLATLAFLVSTTFAIVVWTPEQAGFPETVLSMHLSN